MNLSDLNWTSMTNAWGPAEKNRSNGEMGAADGKAIAIRSFTYSNGIGTHAGSELVYNIAGAYKSFNTDMGIDNEVNGNGSVSFEIWVDGTKKYDSGTVTGKDAAKNATVDLTGAKTLRLVVNPGTNGNSYDHADWAGATLVKA